MLVLTILTSFKVSEKGKPTCKQNLVFLQIVWYHIHAAILQGPKKEDIEKVQVICCFHLN
jgi:hypothetical protein